MIRCYLGHGRVVVPESHPVGVPAVVVLQQRVGAVLEEQLEHLGVSLLGGHGQWTGSLTTLVVDVSSSCEEDVGNDEVTLPAGREQGRPVATVHTVDLSSVEEQDLHDVGVALPGRHVQGRVTAHAVETGREPVQLQPSCHISWHAGRAR